jgi:hypothetical protein
MCELAEYDIEFFICKRQSLGVAIVPLDVYFRNCAILSRSFQQLRRQIDGLYLRANPGCGDRGHSGATANVKYPHTGRHSREPYQPCRRWYRYPLQGGKAFPRFLLRLLKFGQPIHSFSFKNFSANGLPRFSKWFSRNHAAELEL